MNIVLLILPLVFLFAGAGVYVALLAIGFYKLISGADIPILNKELVCGGASRQLAACYQLFRFKQSIAATVNIIKIPAVTATILLFGFGLLSYTWSATPDRTLDSASKLLALTGVFAFILANSKPAECNYSRYIIAVMFIAPAIIIAKTAGYIHIKHIDKGIAYYMLVLPVFYSHLLIDKKYKLAVYASLILTIAALFMQTMDAAKIAIIITAVFVFMHSKDIKLSAATWLIPAAIFLLPALTNVLTYNEYAAQLIGQLPESWRIRIAMWQQGYEVIMVHPWSGYGMDSSRTIMHANGEQVFQNHPHNIALQIWVELGLEGALLLAFATYSAFRLANRCAPVYLCIGLIYSVFAFVSFSAFAEWWVSSLYFAIITAKIFQDQRNEA